MSEFNPYREWLGIQATRSISCYQLLGVKRQDKPEQIRTRATQLIQQLHRVDATGREKQRDQLLSGIKRAATILLDAEKRELYDRKLAAKRAEKRKRADQEKDTKVPNPAPAKKSSTKEASAKPAPVAKTASTSQPESHSQPESTSHVSADKLVSKETKKRRKTALVRHTGEKNVTDELMRLRPRRQDIAPAYATQRRKSKAFSYSLMLGALSLFGIGYLLFTQTPWGQALVAEEQTAQDLNQPVAVKPNSRDASTTESPSEVGTPIPPEQPVGNAMNTSTQFVQTAGADDSATSIQTQLAMGNIELPSEPRTDSTNRAHAMELFKQARELLGERKIQPAKAKLEEARPYTSEPATQMMLGRLETLSNYVEAYWQATNDQLDSFKSGSEAQIGGQRVMVVESTPEQIVLRIAGKNRTINRQEEQPLTLAMKLADTWFEEDAASTKVFRGAMMAVTPDFEAEDARALWREAEATGEINLGDLEQVLDDKYE